MKLYNKNELTNSRIFFDKQPPMFLTIFILSVLFLVVLFFFITSTLIRTYVVTAQGMVTTKDLTFVGAFTDGIIDELIHSEGSFVERGDVLFTVSSGVEGLQYQTLIDQLEHQEEILKIMDLFDQSIEERLNHMTNSGIQQEYYARIEHYLLAIQNEQDNIGMMEADLDEQRDQVNNLNSDISRLNGEISTLKSRETSLESQIQNTPAEIEEVIAQPRLAYDDSIEISTSPTIDIPTFPIEPPILPPTMIPNPEYIRLNNELEEVRSERHILEGQRDGYILERDSVQADIRRQERQPEPTNVEQTRIQLLADLGASRTSAETRIVELEAQLATHRTQDDLYEVRANQTGYVHYLLPLREGMMIQRMQSIAEISMNLEAEMQVEVFIPAYRISRVEIGQDVNVAIEGVNVSKYGTIQGELISIDIGTMSQETPQGNMIFYRGVVSINDTYLKASNGDMVYVLRSMPVTARIVYERETYLDWILSMLHFRNE